MTKKILTLAIAFVASFALITAQADDEKGKGKGKGKPGHGDPAKRADMMLKKLDKDGDGKLSKKEFAASPMAAKMEEKRGKGAIDKVFAMRDENSDGFLDKKELSKPPKHGKGRPDGKGKGKPGDKKKEGDKKEGDS